MKPLVTFKNLSKRYVLSVNTESASFWQALFPKINSIKSKKAIHSISGTFFEGEIIGIIGKNGAGKSTLLHMISGTSSPSQGELVVNGAVSAILTLGIGLREEATGIENIQIDAQLRGIPADKMNTAIENVIQFAELGEYIYRPVRTYSTGMKSRLSFSMLVNICPEILIIDEALGAGDLHFALKAKDKIKELCNSGKLVIIVSHSMPMIREMCSRCLWIENGQIRMDGHPADVTHQYLKEVRNADEKLLIQGMTFSSKIEFYQEGEKRNILDMAVPVEVHISDLKETPLGLLFSTLDGTAVWKIKIDKTSNQSLLKIKLDPFLLGAGHYVINLVGIENENITQQIEVRTTKDLIGGTPQFFLQSSINKVEI